MPATKIDSAWEFGGDERENRNWSGIYSRRKNGNSEFRKDSVFVLTCSEFVDRRNKGRSGLCSCPERDCDESIDRWEEGK